MAPQLMATNGPEPRPDRAWMARATSSLPVPLSPVTSTVVLKSAILEMVRKMSSISLLLARIDSNWFSFWICSLSARFSRRKVSRSSALRSASTISSGLKGLLT